MTTERDHERVTAHDVTAHDVTAHSTTRSGPRLEAHGHRGARGLRPENTLPGFAHALEIGVDAVELDVGLTSDGSVVVNHDQVLSEVTCKDVAAAWPGDPAYPYVGRRIRDLTLAQLKTVDAGVRRGDDGDPLVLTQLPLPGTPLPTLAEVCALVDAYDNQTLTLAVEIKTDPLWPEDEVEFFVEAVVQVLEAYDFVGRSRLLAFDWRVLAVARRLAPAAGRVALAEERTLDPGNGWQAGLTTCDAGLAAAARAAGATALSPQHRLVSAGLVAEARSEGLPVSAWTVNEPQEMVRLIELDVDAIVTDYPDRLRAVMTSHGLPLPPLAVPRPAAVSSSRG